MALVLADRVQELGGDTGSASFSLSGAVAGFQSFAVIGNLNTTYYGATDASGNWEVGIGLYISSIPILNRLTILASSNSGSMVTFSGTVSIFATYPAEKSVNLDADGVMAVGQPISYSDTGVLATFVSTEAGYNQVVIQNKSTATNASSNLNVSHNSATDTEGFAELGINSTTFTGTGSFSIPGASYLASASTDLTIGTYGAYDLHFVTNSNTTDSMTIFDDGGVSLGGLPSPGIGNIACNNIDLAFQSIVTAAGTTTLTNASPYYTQFTGTTTQTLVLPDATTCPVGATFILDNDSTGDVTIKDGAGTTFELLIPGGVHNFVLEDNGTVAGTWIRYSSIPSTVEWGTNSLQLGSTTITGGTWQGGTIQPGYGGTGLTTFVGANNALYSTSSSALTAGTLPVAAGGTGATSFTTNYVPYSDGSTLTSSSSFQFDGTSLRAGASAPLGGTTNPIATFTGGSTGYVQTYIYNSTNGTASSADFVAYASNSTDSHGWADIGFTSPAFADTSYSITGPNEAYVFGSAPSGAGATGNLVYATDSTGSANAHQWYVGGFAQNKNAWKMQLDSTGLQTSGSATFGTGSANYQQLVGAATTLAPVLSVAGSDTNVALAIKTQGTGAIDLAAGSRGVNISNGGTVTAITGTNIGASYTSFPSVVISAPTTAGGVQATASVAGMISNNPVTIVSGGTGYTVGDTLTVVGGTSISGAATLTVSSVSAGVITAVFNLNFAGYTVLPTNPVSVTGGTGTGATFNLTYSLRFASGFTITNAGSGYVEQPTVSFSGGGGSGAAAYATVGSQAIIKSIGSSTGTITVQSLMFQTPSGNSLMLRDSNRATPDAHLMGQATASGYALLMAEGSNANASLYVGAKGSGSIRFNTSSTSLTEQMRVSHTASAVNYVQVTGSITSNIFGPVISAQGSDAAVPIRLSAKGGSAISFSCNNSTTQFTIENTSSSVNYLTATGGAASSAPILKAQGTDTNIDLALTPKGTGVVKTSSTGIQLVGSSSGYVGLKGAAAAGSTTYTLPAADGSSGYALTTDGAGTLSWAAAGSNVTTKGLFENANTISANYSITSGNNAVSAGPVTVNSGVSVTVPTGSVWTVV